MSSVSFFDAILQGYVVNGVFSEAASLEVLSSIPPVITYSEGKNRTQGVQNRLTTSQYRKYKTYPNGKT